MEKKFFYRKEIIMMMDENYRVNDVIKKDEISSETMLEGLGRMGWELVSVIQVGKIFYGFFKRENI